MFTSNTRIIDLTVGELESILQKYLPKDQPRADGEPPQVIRGLKAIAQTLGISEKTLTRWRQNKIIGYPTIMQVGNVITAERNQLLNFKAKTNKSLRLA
jgi:hypothetical protein